MTETSSVLQTGAGYFNQESVRKRRCFYEKHDFYNNDAGIDNSFYRM